MCCLQLGGVVAQAHFVLRERRVQPGDEPVGDAAADAHGRRAPRRGGAKSSIFRSRLAGCGVSSARNIVKKLFDFKHLQVPATATFHNRRARGKPMEVKIKALVAFRIAGPALEDALAEYDELTVSGMLREAVDKAIAVDELEVEVTEGPNTLEEYDTHLSN